MFFVLLVLKYVAKLLSAISGFLLSCLSRYVPALLYVCGHEYLFTIEVGFEIMAPAGNFLDKLLFRPLMWRKGRMFIAPLTDSRFYSQRLHLRPQCWETVQKKLSTFCFEWLVCVLRTYFDVQRERTESILL